MHNFVVCLEQNLIFVMIECVQNVILCEAVAAGNGQTVPYAYKLEM